MYRKSKTSKRNRDQYIYYTSEGSQIVLTPGENGVTAANIALLHEFDDSEFDNNRVNESRQLRFEAIRSNEDEEDMSDRLPEMEDDSQDILRLLEQAEENDKLYEALKNLLPQQKELIEDIFFKGHRVIDIARRQGVSHVAIIDRLKRIYKKLERNL